MGFSLAWRQGNRNLCHIPIRRQMERQPVYKSLLRNSNRQGTA